MNPNQAPTRTTGAHRPEFDHPKLHELTTGLGSPPDLKYDLQTSLVAMRTTLDRLVRDIFEAIKDDARPNQETNRLRLWIQAELVPQTRCQITGALRDVLVSEAEDLQSRSQRLLTAKDATLAPALDEVYSRAATLILRLEDLASGRA